MSTDYNFKSFDGYDGHTLTEFEAPSNPLAYDDILKASNCSALTVEGVTIPGGRENCFDAVRGEGISLRRCTLLAGQSQAAAVFKGSIDGWGLFNCTIEPAKETDIEIGQFDKYWTPGRKPTRSGVIAGTKTTTGEPVHVKIWDGTVPQVFDSDVHIERVSKWIWFPYFLFRYCVIRLHEYVPVLACMFLLAGCVAGKPGGAAWYKPWTWGSTTEAARAEKATERRDDAREKTIKAAQKTAHETALALEQAPASRPVEVASEANDQTVALLDQAAGPLTAAELEKLRVQVEKLISENAAARAEGERLRRESRQDIAALSAKLAEAQAKLDAANKALPEAQRREAETANKYRALQWAFWGVAILASLLAAASFYLRYAYGGIPQAIGRGLSTLRATDPQAGKLATQILDGLLNRDEQARIARHA